MRAVLKNNIPTFRSRMARVKWAIKAKYKERVTEELERARNDVARRTPKNSGKMASGWRYRVIGGSPKGRTPVAGWVWNHWAEGGRWKYAKRRARAQASFETFSGNTDKESGDTHIRSGAQLSSITMRSRSIVVKTDGRKVLKILEYGSQPHEIRAAHLTKAGRPGFLVFRAMGVGSARAGSQMDDVVFTNKPVQHPGTRPYMMIRFARVQFRKRMGKLNREVAKVAQRVIEGKEK